MISYFKILIWYLTLYSFEFSVGESQKNVSLIFLYIYVQALLCPEKEKDDVVYSLEDKGPVRGGDPLLGASGEQPGHSVERTCRKRRLSESSMFDIPATAHGPKVKSTTSTEKMLFESPADLMQDDINPEMESPCQFLQCTLNSYFTYLFCINILKQ